MAQSTRATKTTIAQLTRASKGGLLTPSQAAVALGLSSREASARLTALVNTGWLARIRRGLYVILPLAAATPLATTSEDPWMLATVLYEPCYIGGWSAAEHWNLTEQIFRSTFVVTAAHIRRREETHFGAAFHLARTKAARIEDIQPVWRSSQRVKVSNRERTIVDGAITPAWIGGGRQLEAVVKAYRDQPNARAEALAEELGRNGNGAAAKRLGYLVEATWPEATILIDTCRELQSTGIVKLDPSLPHRGRLVTRWGLWENVRREGPLHNPTQRSRK